MATSGSFTNGLCDICAEPGGCGGCCYAMLFPCCAFGDVVVRLTPEEAVCGGNCCGACCCMSLVSSLGMACFYQTSVRGAVRRKYGIQGSCCADCITAMCCGTCTLIQMSNELQGRNAPKLDKHHHQQQQQVPYQAPIQQQQVVYQPQQQQQYQVPHPSS